MVKGWKKEITQMAFFWDIVCQCYCCMSYGNTCSDKQSGKYKEERDHFEWSSDGLLYAAATFLLSFAMGTLIFSVPVWISITTSSFILFLCRHKEVPFYDHY